MLVTFDNLYKNMPAVMPEKTQSIIPNPASIKKDTVSDSNGAQIPKPFSISSKPITSQIRIAHAKNKLLVCFNVIYIYITTHVCVCVCVCVCTYCGKKRNRNSYISHIYICI